MKKAIIKKSISFTIIGCLALSSVSFGAASKPKLTKTSKSTKEGSTFSLKVSNANKKIRWSSNKKNIVKITRTYGAFNQNAQFKALKSGSATIIAKLGKKSFKCKVTVKKKNTSGKGNTVYIADTGTKYHTKNCRYVAESKTAVKLSWAKANGYEPCKVCH